MYSVCILRQAIKDIANLPKDYARLASQHIDRLEENPRPSDAKKLHEMTDYTLRVGVYRILYDIDDRTHTVTVYRIKHRRDVYR
ncbi:type II toxin-antitoxin system RelE/ParE family toxin [bacterium]|nr:type II toxin-antitoxin system RelE/ParE family toxin [bacterium]MBU1752942.1 type II toxin-antitoxin system RelE/ParE family toxin [bacterium]